MNFVVGDETRGLLGSTVWIKVKFLGIIMLFQKYVSSYHPLIKSVVKLNNGINRINLYGTELFNRK